MHRRRLSSRAKSSVYRFACTGLLAAAGCSVETASALAQTSDSNGEASKPPAQILHDSMAALRRAQSYRLTGDVTVPKTGVTPMQRFRLSLTDFSPTAFSMSISEKGVSISVMLDKSRAYVRGNRAYWWKVNDSKALVKRVANHWIDLPASKIKSFVSAERQFDAAHLSHCMAVGKHGKLTLAGHTRIDNQPAIVVRDAGNAPGAQPTTYAVALTGRPYLLRVVATGKQRPGGSTACGGNGGTTDGTMNFDSYDTVGKVSPPAHPVSLGSLKGGTKSITPLGGGTGPVNR